MKKSRMRGRLDRRRFLKAGLSVLGTKAVLASTQALGSGPHPPILQVSSHTGTDTLRHRATRAGVRMGSALRSAMLREKPEYTAFFLAECSSITPEWEMKWESLAYSGPDYYFDDCDLIVELAQRNGLSVRGHTLLWHRATPRWAEQHMRRFRDWKLIEQHIRKVVSRYGEAVDQWDVVNEPIDAYGPGGLRANIFHEIHGPDYIEEAIRLTHEIAPHARLFINDFSFEYASPEEHARRSAMIALAEHLLARGAPLSGIGIQAHLDLSKGRISQSDVNTFFSRISAMGLEIAITELDVKEADVTLPTDQRDVLVAQTVREYLDVALAHRAVRSLTTWGLSDRYSWLSEPPQGVPGNRGLPYDEHWLDKPMRQAVLEALTERSALAERA